jgi:hypothetical protein
MKRDRLHRRDVADVPVSPDLNTYANALSGVRGPGDMSSRGRE